MSKDANSRCSGHHPDVVVRAGADAIEAKGAINIAGFSWQIKNHLAPSLLLIAAQTVVSFAAGANGRFADFDFERRNQRSHKLELTDRTNVFAEAGAAEKGVNRKGHEEIVNYQPGCPHWLVPEGEDF